MRPTPGAPRVAVLVRAGWVSTLLALGCSDSPLPGTLLGTYRVEGTLQANTCGAGLGAPNPWTFDVLLSQKGTTLYWSWLDGRAPLSNTLDGNATNLTVTSTANVDGTVDGGLGPCTMQRTDSIGVALAAGSPPRGFAGTIEYAFSVAAGADCSDQLGASGGSYGALPCSTRYTTTASRQ